MQKLDTRLRGYDGTIRRARGHGYILLPVVLLIALVAVVAFLLNNESALDGGITESVAESAEAEYVAQAGLQHALQKTRLAGCGPYTDLTGEPLGNHSYTTTLTTNLGATSSYTLNVDQDTWIRSDNPTDNKATDQRLHIRFEGGIIERPMYRYDLSALPANARVLSATAWFHVTKEHPEGPADIHALTATWTEIDATWNTMGANMDSTVLASIPAQPSDDTWVPVDLTAQVQGWVNGQPNYGIALNSTSEGVHGDYASREEGGKEPYLVVVVGSPPTSASLQATGTLTNGVSRTISRDPVTLYQYPPGVLQLQPDAVEGEDAEIWDQAPNNNYGNAAETWVSSATNDTTRSLLRFNIGAIPAGARILEASLSLRRRSGSGADQPVSAHRIRNPWSENSVSWRFRKSGTLWDTAGGDFDNMAVATTPVGPVNQRYTWNIKPLVQGWVDGSYPNHGVVLVAAIAGMPGERFDTSDHADPTRRPGLNITYTCECGVACVAPQGAGKVVMIGNYVGIFPDPRDSEKEAIIESWGYDVDIWDDDFIWGINFSNYDVVYVSETAASATVGTQLTNLSIGVVNEQGKLNDELELSGGMAIGVGSVIDVTDNSHYITTPFAQDLLPIYSADMEMQMVSGTTAPGLQTLAEFSSVGSLAVLDAGMPDTGGGTAAGRRVTLPLGRVTNSDFNWRHLNNNGRLLVQRAIQWGTGNTAGASAPQLLFVVEDAGTLTAQEIAKQLQFDTWGYAVTVIGESDSQANYDAAVALSDVVFIGEDVASGAIGTKLVDAPIGVVTEEDNLSDEFGLSAGVNWETATQVEINDNSHYITSPFPTGLLTILTASESMAYVTGAQSPDLGKLASSTSGFNIVTLEAGAATYTGGFAAGRRVQLPWGNNNFDFNHLNSDGRTILQRALEWGTGASLAPPQVILFVVPDATALTAQDAAKKALMESWGFSVSLITAADSQANFDAAAASADVAYITEEVTSSDVGTKLRDATIGVVSEETALTDEFGIAGVRTGYTGTDIEVVNTTHYITSVFASGPLTIASASTGLNRLTASLAPGLDALAETTGDPELATLETGGVLYDAGTAAGRRVQLPWGSDAFDINLLNSDGQTLMRRAIEWGAGAGGGATLPIAHWKFDEGSGPTAFDSVGGNDATLNGNPTWTTGTLGGALDFDGSGDYAITGSNFTPPPIGTVTFWMQVSGSPASHGRILGLHDQWEIRHVTTGTPDGIPYGLVFDLGLSGVNTEFVTTTTVDTPGQWYHIAASYDTTNDAYAVYIDGVPHKSGTYPSALAVPAANQLSIGTRTGSTNYFDGVLDDVRVYDEFLSAAEIADLAAGGGGGGGGGSPTIVEVQVTTGNDDAEERLSNGNVDLTSTDLELISDGSNAQLVGMRFTGVAIPNGATISSAWIQFQVDETNTGATNVNIQGEASDSALQFTTANSNITSRSQTTASVPWAPVSWTTVGEAGPDQRTPDISAVIQEIVSRPGWASGNDMVMLVSGSGERTAESYNGSSTGAALLHIEY